MKRGKPLKSGQKPLRRRTPMQSGSGGLTRSKMAGRANSGLKRTPLKVIGKAAPKRQAKYAAFLRSKAWKEQRARVLDRDGHRCTHWGRVGSDPIRCSSQATTVHHTRYSTPISATPDSALLSLCAYHHALIDGYKAHRALAVRGMRA